MNGRIDKEALKAFARGRELELLEQLAGVPADYLDDTREHPCPWCNHCGKRDISSGGEVLNPCFNLAAVESLRKAAPAWEKIKLARCFNLAAVESLRKGRN